MSIRLRSGFTFLPIRLARQLNALSACMILSRVRVTNTRSSLSVEVTPNFFNEVHEELIIIIINNASGNHYISWIYYSFDIVFQLGAVIIGLLNCRRPFWIKNTFMYDFPFYSGQSGLVRVTTYIFIQYRPLLNNFIFVFILSLDWHNRNIAREMNKYDCSLGLSTAEGGIIFTDSSGIFFEQPLIPSLMQ